MEKCGTRPNHSRRLADDLPKTLVFLSQGGLLQSVLQNKQDTFTGERLLEKVEGAVACRLDGIGDTAVTRNHHDGGAVVVVTKRPQDIDTISIWKLDVQQIRIRAPVRPICLELRRRAANRNSITFALEDQL